MVRKAPQRLQRVILEEHHIPITLNLALEDEAQLSAIAAQKGQDASAVAYTIFTAALAEFNVRQQSLTNGQLPAEVELSPEEEAEAISIGLDASFAGRVTPLAEWSARFRARHNIPAGARAMTHEEALRLP